MIALIGAVCAMLVFAGGYLAATDLLGGLLLTSFGVIGLGTIVAYLQDVANPVVGVSYSEGMDVGSLIRWLATNGTTIKEDTKVYVGDNGLHPAGAVFACILDGRRAIVVERKAEETETAHDLF